MTPLRVGNVPTMVRVNVAKSKIRLQRRLPYAHINEGKHQCHHGEAAYDILDLHDAFPASLETPGPGCQSNFLAGQHNVAMLPRYCFWGCGVL